MPTARCVRDYKFHLYSYTSWQGRPFCISCGTSPVATLLAVGASKAPRLIAPNGDNSNPQTPSTNPMRFGCAQAFRRLTTNKLACLPLCNPSLYPRDQPSAVWIPPLHGDHKAASPPLWTPTTKGLFAPL